MNVEVIVPWRGGCPHRERALHWAMSRYRWPITVAEVEGAPDESWAGGDLPVRTERVQRPWVKALAVMPAVSASTADWIVVADADVWCDGLEEALGALLAGAGDWAIPHGQVHRLDPEATSAVLAGKPWRTQPVEQKPYHGLPGGGYVIAPRALLLEAPLDPRFVGWGQEDEAWACALSSLGGKLWRGSADLVHLFHPPQERLTRRHGSQESWALRRRYLRARHDPVQMRALISEAHVSLSAAQPRSDDRAPDLVRGA